MHGGLLQWLDTPAAPVLECPKTKPTMPPIDFPRVTERVVRFTAPAVVAVYALGDTLGCAAQQHPLFGRQVRSAVRAVRGAFQHLLGRVGGLY